MVIQVMAWIANKNFVIQVIGWLTNGSITDGLKNKLLIRNSGHGLINKLLGWWYSGHGLNYYWESKFSVGIWISDSQNRDLPKIHNYLCPEFKCLHSHLNCPALQNQNFLSGIQIKPWLNEQTFNNNQTVLPCCKYWTSPAFRSPLYLVFQKQVLLEGSLEGVLSSPGVSVENVAPENDRVGLGEFGVRTGVDGRVASRVACFDPNGGWIVFRVEGAFGNSVSNAWNNTSC